MNRIRKTVVLDTSAFIAGFDPSMVDDELYSVPTVGEELANGSLPRLRFEAAVQIGRLKVIDPDSSSIDGVKKSSTDIGDMKSLSEADVKILALALMLKRKGLNPTILTDDYSIQNVSKEIGLQFTPLMTYGIRFFLKWIIYCPACRRKYPSNYRFEECETCGTKLKRKPFRKKRMED